MLTAVVALQTAIDAEEAAEAADAAELAAREAADLQAALDAFIAAERLTSGCTSQYP